MAREHRDTDEKETVKEEQPADTRVEAILRGAASAFSARGFAATSMREVARRSGASLGSIYYHFDGKEEILRALIGGSFQRVLDRLHERLEGVEDPEERLRIFVRNHVRFFARHLEEMRVMAHELDTLEGTAGEEVARLRRAYMDAAVEILGALRPDLGADELRIRTLCLFGMLNWTYRWFHTVERLRSDELAARMTRLFLHGFLAEEPRT